MVIYTTAEAAGQLELKTDTVRAYCKRYGIGEQHGKVWLLDEHDLAVIRSRMREEGLGTDCEVLDADEYKRGE